MPPAVFVPRTRQKIFIGRCKTMIEGGICVSRWSHVGRPRTLLRDIVYVRTSSRSANDSMAVTSFNWGAPGKLFLVPTIEASPPNQRSVIHMNYIQHEYFFMFADFAEII
eukprot:scaffold10255_cov84-Cylindrotheca_fusiformis.AAC.3